MLQKLANSEFANSIRRAEGTQTFHNCHRRPASLKGRTAYEILIE
jgi:hypothetical protein